MLSKVTNRVKRRSVQPISLDSPQSREVVYSAPDLVRWCDLDNPFPSVAFGGYSRYYRARCLSDCGPTPSYCPVLSQYPEASSSKAPARKPLFITPPIRSLTIIHEASKESMSPRRLRNLSIATVEESPKSLRRTKGRILRTPSIERDFAEHARQLFAPAMSIRRESSSSTTSSTDTSSNDLPSSQASSSSESLSHSSSSQFDSNVTDSPITPTTSIGSGEDNAWIYSDGECYPTLTAKSELCPPVDTTPKRPDSRASFMTAKSSLSNHEEHHLGD